MDRGPAGPVIFFDGVCALCNAFIDFVMARDRRGVFRFAALQGETAAGLLREPGAPMESTLRPVRPLSEWPPIPKSESDSGAAEGTAGGGAEAAAPPTPPASDAGNWMRSIVLRDKDGLHRKSEAALRVLIGLGGAWRLAGWLRIIPRPLRDAVYDIIARNRYRWFGKREACRMPTPAERDRFLP